MKPKDLVCLILLGMSLVAACSAPCQDSLGAYPPAHIVVTGAERVEIPHIAWTCPDFHSDSMDPPPSVSPDPGGRLKVEVALEAGSAVDVRFGNQEAPVEPAPVGGPNTWTFEVPPTAEPLIVRICAEDDRCALYWVNTYGG